MNERQRSILQEVADGKITPEDAVHLLDEAEEPARGDPAWYASRPGRARRQGRHEPSGHWHHGQWEAHWGPGPWGPPGPPHPGPGGHPGWAGRWALLDAFRRFGEELTVRMRPDLALDASVTAGSLKIAGVTGPLRVAVAGGSAKLDRFAG